MIPTFDTSWCMGDIWLTADWHLGHKNILKYTKRPWNNIDKHDNSLIKNAQEVVKPNDIFIMNGDLTLEHSDSRRRVQKWVEKIPGTKILVLGNHDRMKPDAYIRTGFSLVATSLVLNDGVLVAHDPAVAQAWPSDRPVICGHIHGLFKVMDNVVNVGVDVHNYYPIKLKSALSLCSSTRNYKDRWLWLSKDRHRLETVTNVEGDSHEQGQRQTDSKT